jgi:hypothetical protein
MFSNNLLLAFFVLVVRFATVNAGRAFEDKIVEDHAYYTMSLYQVTVT